MKSSELAKAVGCTPQHLSGVLTGRRTPSAELRRKIERALSLSPSPAPEPEPEPEPKPADPRQSPGFIGNIPPAERLRIALEDLRSTPRAQPVQDGEP